MCFVFVFNLSLLFPSSQLFHFSLVLILWSLSEYFVNYPRTCVKSTNGCVCSSPSSNFISCVFCKFSLQAPVKLGLLFPYKSCTPLWLNFLHLLLFGLQGIPSTRAVFIIFSWFEFIIFLGHYNFWYHIWYWVSISWKILFVFHPDSQQFVSFFSPLPSWWVEFV